MSLFKIYRADGHFVIKLGNIKIRFKNPLINRLRDCCCIVNPDYFLKQGTTFIHPIGIVIHKNVKIGKNCYIYQNVTIGGPKPNEYGEYHAPQIGDNVVIFANSCIIGNVIIGNNSIIGAGAVVVKDVPPNSVVAGNPAKVIKTCIEDSL